MVQPLFPLVKDGRGTDRHRYLELGTDFHAVKPRRCDSDHFKRVGVK